MTTVVVVDEAEAQLVEIHEWWVAHRDSSMLVLDEFERCVSLLQEQPPYRHALPPHVRSWCSETRDEEDEPPRLLLHDEPNEIVYISAVWGTPKSGAPSLIDPR